MSATVFVMQEDGEFCVVSQSSYPALYQRSLDGETIRVILNPSAREYTLSDIHPDEVYISHNITFENGDARIGGCSYAVYKVK